MADNALNLADSVKTAVEEEAKKGTGGADRGVGDSKGDKSAETGSDAKPKTEQKAEEKPAKEDKSVGDTGEASEVQEVDLSPEELDNAVRLFKALANPETRSGVVEMIAKQSGYDLTQKKDQKSLTRDLKTVLREKLGDSADILQSDKIAEALEETLEERVKKITEPIIAKIQQAEQDSNVQKANDAMDAMFKRHEIAEGDREKIAGLMLKKMEKMPATPSTNIIEYLDDIYSLVSKDSARGREVKKVVDKINQNAKDVRASGDGGTDDKRLKTSTGLPSLREAVEAAFRGERLED